MSEYTPGPWKISKCQCGHSACESYLVSAIGADGRCSLEDAQLIAAAPDMRETLGEILDCEESFYTEQGGIRLPKELSPWSGPLSVIFMVARKALKKADFGDESCS